MTAKESDTNTTAFPTSESPHLFTEKADPTVVECRKLHEEAETKRKLLQLRHESKRDWVALWSDNGFLTTFGLTFSIGSIVAAITIGVVAGDYAPQTPESAKAALSVKASGPCVDSVRQEEIMNGSPMSCPPGALMSFERTGESMNKAIIRCTCPKETFSKETSPKEKETEKKP